MIKLFGNCYPLECSNIIHSIYNISDANLLMDSSWDVDDPVVNRNMSTNNNKNCMRSRSFTSKNEITPEEFNFTGLSIDDEPSNCKECDQTFKQTYCFLAHLSVHMPEGTLNTDAAGNSVSAEEIKNKSYVCPVCRKRFRKKIIL
ncbi:hypothetical protein CEXT_155151 [Caerostris extrusa]|uniref:C2H2-type domain-containing protein n=1 Tax=Caerostris extrusa TaxID=172846 RepID=A0AAV4TGB4_CAEEX|nr:hypothetical protein CEXT_155151 [Caerostris extrusa]